MAITKIKAVADRPKQTTIKQPKKSIVKQPKTKKGIIKLLFNIGRYFKGAWQELGQVRWPDRKSAWAMTSAVILFTGFFVGLIILLDFLFQILFKYIIK